jgi:hypothetical protein
MTHSELERLIRYLNSKLCTPCRNGTPTHTGCREALELIDVAERDLAHGPSGSKEIPPLPDPV